MYRIGYDAKRLFNNFTGLGNYSRTLLYNLANYYPDNAYFLYTPKVTKNSETHFFLNSPYFSVQFPSHKRQIFWRSFGVKSTLKRHKLHLYHGLSHEIPFGIKKTGIKTVVTIHDLLFKHYPQQYNWIDRQIYDLKFSYACENADRIVAISENTKQDIVRFYGIDPARITVIYQSCHERFMQERSHKTIDAVLKKYQLPPDYLLSVGSVIERKNLLGIAKAMAMVPKDLRLPLVVVGKGNDYLHEVKSFLHAERLDSLVHFVDPGFDDLPALYQQADLFLYPSFGEGFGIPILEALFSETPVITSKISSLPEAAGPDSYLVDPANPAEIAAGIEKILTDEVYRKNMVAKGFEYAQRFRGEALTAQMMKLYEELLYKAPVKK